MYRDIYYHEPRTFLEAIPTPFGYIHATCNEKTISMQVKMDAYTYTPYNEPGKEANIPYMRIEIDVRDFRERVCQDDFCKFSKFKYLSAEKTPNISCRHIS